MSPRASLGWVLCAALALARVAGAQDNLGFARQRFQRGAELYAAHQFTDALAEFRASVQLYSSPNTRLFIARCLVDLGRLGDAVDEYTRVLGEAAERGGADPRYLQAAVDARSELAAIEPRVARVVVVVAPGAPPGTRVFVAGREIPPAAWGLSLTVSPGAVDVELRAPDRAPVHTTTVLAPGAQGTVALALGPSIVRSPQAIAPRPRPPEFDSGARALTGAGLGVGALGVASLATFAALAAGQHAALVRDCGGRVQYCPQQLERVATGEAFQVLANASIAVAAAGGAAALVGALWWWRLDRAGATPHARLAFTGTGVAVEGTF